MGFLDRLLGKKSGAEKTTTEVGLHELEPLLEKRLEEAAARTLEDARRTVETIAREGGGILETLEEIEGKVFPEEVEKRIYKPVKTARPTYVKGMRKAVGEMKAGPDGRDIEGYHTYRKKLMATLKFVEKLQMGSGRYLALAYEDEVMRIGGCLNRIIDAGKELEESLEGYQERAALAERIRELKGELEAFREKLEGQRHGASSWEGRKEELEGRISGTEEALEALKRSRDYRDLQEKEAAMEEKEKGMEEIRAEVFSLLSPLGRLFRKYHKLLEGTKEARAVDGFVRDPVGRFLEGEDPGYILEGMKKALDQGHLVVKKKEMKRVMPKLERALAADFRGLLRRYRDLEAERAGLSRAIASDAAGKRRRRLERELEAYREELEELLQNPPGEEPEDRKRYRQGLGELEALLGELMETEVTLRTPEENPY
ncbi:MAG: hypothetical protein GXO65_01710 [Euryarchaeota archaeon]|nr:hypothetical protein [Euryarchaeota archaeon]